MKRLTDLLGGGGANASFAGLETCEDLAELVADVALIGAPVATPYPRLGAYAAGAPAAIREAVAGFVGPTWHMDFDLGGPLVPAGVHAVDCGDVDGDPEDAEGNRARIARAVRAILDAGAVPVVLGGDDSVPIPVFGAFEGRGPFTVVQVDAHLDWRDEVDGERMGLSSPMRRASEMPWVEGIVQIGARGIGSARPADRDDALAWGARLFTARDVHARGVGPAIDAVPEGAEVLLTVDVDGLDPSVVPAVIGPAPGGLSYNQVLELMCGIALKARIACFDVVELMPERDVGGLGALVAGRLACSAIGLVARQRAAEG